MSIFQRSVMNIMMDFVDLTQGHFGAEVRESTYCTLLQNGVNTLHPDTSPRVRNLGDSIICEARYQSSFERYTDISKGFEINKSIDTEILQYFLSLFFIH